MILIKSCELSRNWAGKRFTLRFVAITVFFMCRFAVPLAAQSDSLGVVFQRGNSFYEQKKYHEAILEFDKILRAGYLNVPLLYNLGNAHYRIKAYGKSIFFYEKALKLSPEDEDVRFNLQMANLKKIDQIDFPPDIPLLSFLADLKSFFPLPLMLILVLVAYYGAIALLVIRMLRPEWSSLFRFRITRYAVTILLLVFLPLSGARVYDDLTRVEAVILEKVVEVRSGPSDAETGLFLLHEGTKVEVKNQKGSWLEIRLPDGKVGWILENFAGIV